MQQLQLERRSSAQVLPQQPEAAQSQAPGARVERELAGSSNSLTLGAACDQGALMLLSSFPGKEKGEPGVASESAGAVPAGQPGRDRGGWEEG